MRYYPVLLLLLALLAACQSEKKAYYIFSRRSAAIMAPAGRQAAADKSYMQPLRNSEVVGEALPCPNGRQRRKAGKNRMVHIPVNSPDRSESTTLQ